MSLKNKKVGPDFFLDIFLRGKHSQNSYEELHRDLTKAFHIVANCVETPVPYNPEFLKFITENSGELLHHIEEKYGPIISAPQDLQKWEKIHFDKLKHDYQNWLELKSHHHVYSYFAVSQYSVGFIGVLQARIERDIKNIPDNHITGSKHPSCIKKTSNNSFRLVKYYLISKLKIPRIAVEEALRTVVIQWEDSILNQFANLFGSSFSFLFTALYFACTLQNLIAEGIVTVTNRETGDILKPVDVQIPHDIMLSGGFHFDKIPNEHVWEESYKTIPSKMISSVPAKTNSALYVNTVVSIFEKCLFPAGVQLNETEVLENARSYSENGNRHTLFLIPVADVEDLIEVLFPFDIVPAKNPFTTTQKRDRLNLQGAELVDVNFSGSDLRGANLREANLKGANLTGSNLTGANLTGANLTEADFTGANLRGADLQWSDLTNTCLKDTDLRGTNFRGANFNWTNLQEADLRGSNLKKNQLKNTDLGRANLTGSDLSQVDFKQANLTGAELRGTELKGAEFEQVNLINTCLKQVDFAEANLREANLTGADLTGANLQRVNLYKANCTQANFERANLTGANLEGVNFTGANLTETILQEANLERADLTEANLSHAKLISTNLTGADMTEANLTDANLNRANLIDADMTKTNLERSNLVGTKLTGIYLTKSHLVDTRIDKKSKEYLEEMAAKEKIHLSGVIWI